MDKQLTIQTNTYRMGSGYTLIEERDMEHGFTKLWVYDNQDILITDFNGWAEAVVIAEEILKLRCDMMFDTNTTDEFGNPQYLDKSKDRKNDIIL